MKVVTYDIRAKVRHSLIPLLRQHLKPFRPSKGRKRRFQPDLVYENILILFSFNFNALHVSFEENKTRDADRQERTVDHAYPGVISPTDYVLRLIESRMSAIKWHDPQGMKQSRPTA